VLFIRRRSRRAVNVDLGMTALAGLFGVAAVWSGSPWLYLLTLLPAAAAIDNSCLLHRVGPDLVLRKLFRRRRCLVATRHRFGFQPQHRLLMLYVTDGRATVDVISYRFLRQAAAATAGLNEALLDEPTGQTRSAVRQVTADQSAMGAATAASKAYYQRPAYRWFVIAVIVFAVIYSIVGFILFHEFLTAVKGC
jgi:hypothetical protein